MKNIQVIDGALNCTYPIYEVSDRIFRLIFPRAGQDIEFAKDAIRRLGRSLSRKVFPKIWEGSISKKSAKGIHGTLFYELEYKREFYPRKRESDLGKLRYVDGRFQLPKGAVKNKATTVR